METTIETLIEDGYIGIDASLDISLFEYGMVCKEISPNNYHIIYKLQDDAFSAQTLTSDDIIEFFKESWFDTKSFENFTGCECPDVISNKYQAVGVLSDMVSFYGIDNIFGGHYGSFKIIQL